MGVPFDPDPKLAQYAHPERLVTTQWLEEHEYDSLEQMRGSMNLLRCPDGAETTLRQFLDESRRPVDDVYAKASEPFRKSVSLDDFRQFVAIRVAVLGPFQAVTSTTGGGMSTTTAGTTGEVAAVVGSARASAYWGLASTAASSERRPASISSITGSLALTPTRTSNHPL